MVNGSLFIYYIFILSLAYFVVIGNLEKPGTGVINQIAIVLVQNVLKIIIKEGEK